MATADGGRAQRLAGRPAHAEDSPGARGGGPCVGRGGHLRAPPPPLRPAGARDAGGRAVRRGAPSGPLGGARRAGVAQHLGGYRAGPATTARAGGRLDGAARAREANQGEGGIAELCEHLVGRGVGIEAGLLSVADAESFVRSGLAERCVRALVEPLDADPEGAVAHAAAIEGMLVDAGIRLEQVHHGDGLASWAVNRRALSRGHGIRTGLEDTTVLPDGHPAPDNASLVRAAAAMISQ
jgi:hypothetical protein